MADPTPLKRGRPKGIKNHTAEIGQVALRGEVLASLDAIGIRLEKEMGLPLNRVQVIRHLIWRFEKEHPK